MVVGAVCQLRPDCGNTRPIDFNDHSASDPPGNSHKRRGQNGIV